MRKPQALILLCVILSTSGCVSSPTLTTSPTSSVTHPTPPLGESSIAPDASLSPGQILTYQCLDVAPSLPLGVQPQGILVLFAKQPSLLDLKTNVKTTLKSGQGDFKVSPDGTWLASQYVDQSNMIWLRVESFGNVQQELFPWNDDWFLLGGWLDNNHIWISHNTEPLVTVVNPFSGEQQELVPDFPGLETVAQAGEHFALGVSTVLYDSSLNLAVYPRLENDGYVYIVLWDQRLNSVLAKIRDVAKSFSYLPVWSLDQKEVYVAIADKWNPSKPDDLIYDFFSLARDGQVRQLTDFGAYFADTYIGNASLSPDGKMIAFWLKARPSFHENQQLAVLDLETLQVTNYCIPGSYQGDAPAPIWSLDSRYLAVQNQYEPNAGRVILVETQQGWAAQIAEITQGWPAGWLADH